MIDRYARRRDRAIRLRRRRFLTLATLIAAAAFGAVALGNDPSKARRPADTSNGALAQSVDEPEQPYSHLRARGKAAKVLEAARSQVGVVYAYGAQPRDPVGLDAIGRRKAQGGFDCSSFVAYAFQEGIGEWVSGHIGHTDQIWTQGDRLSLNSTPGETDQVIRGTGARPPRGGYKPGDILLTRWGAGGYWGHVVIVAERGMVIESYPPDVHEAEIGKFLDEGAKLGWVRVKSLAA